MNREVNMHRRILKSNLSKTERPHVYDSDSTADCCRGGEFLHKLQTMLNSVRNYHEPKHSIRDNQNKFAFFPQQEASKTFSVGGSRNDRLDTIYEEDILDCEHLGFEEFLEQDPVEKDEDGDEMMDEPTTDTSASRERPIRYPNAAETYRSNDQISQNDQKIRMDAMKIRILELENVNKLLDLEQQRLSFHKQLLESEDSPKVHKLLDLEQQRLSFHKQLLNRPRSLS